MSEQQSSYRQIFKATSIFGGVQVFSILISIIKAKFVAVFLGTTGVGIMSLLQSVTDTISYLSNLGLNTSAVRDISEANDSQDIIRISSIIKTFRRWLWFSGLLGMTITLCLSPWLSQWTFGNSDYTLSFAILSITLLIGSLAGGLGTQLQGMRRIKHMAQGSILGSTLGLIISIPLYYSFGIQGIVPTFILTSITSLLLSWYYTQKIRLQKVNIPLNRSFHEGLSMVKLGILVTLSSFISMLCANLVNIFISRFGSVSDVGLFQGGFNITNKYVGLVFAALVTDYYPRLSGVNSDNKKVKEIANQQTELALLLLAPILILLLSTTPLVIQLFYTKEFLPIVPFIQWVSLSIIFKAGSWTLGFIVLAKGDSKLYFIKELMMNVVLLICNFIGYYVYGLEGLGISFVIANAIVYFGVYWMVHKRYEFKFTREYNIILIKQLSLCFIGFLLAYILGFPYGYITGAVLFIIVGWLSFEELDKRINIKSVFLERIKKK